MLHLATRLLRVFNAEMTDLSVVDVALQLGLPEGEARSLIDAMCRVGLIECDSGAGRYRPAAMVFDMASACRSASPLISAAIDGVIATSQLSGHTGFVTLLDGADATAVFALPGTSPDRLPLRVSRLPAHVSASGRTMLARLDDTIIRRLHPQLDPSAATALIARLDLLRDEGYEVSRSEAQPGVESVAVAVAAPSERSMVSLCIKYPAGRVAVEMRTTIIADLLARASDIAARMGDTDFVLTRAQEAHA